LYWRNFTDPESAPLQEEEPDRAILEYPIFREAIIEQLSVVRLDREQSSDIEPRTEVWLKEARSVIAVPLIRPSAVGDKNDTIGLLVLAHPTPAQFSDHDKLSLRLFAESVVYGLQTFAFAQARANLMRQLRFDGAKAATPRGLTADSVLDALSDARKAPSLDVARPSLDYALTATQQYMRLHELTQRITTWFLDLSDDDLSPDPEARDGQSAESILTALAGKRAEDKGPADIFAEEIFSKTILWDTPVAPPIPIPGGDEEARLIEAILAQYLEIAFRGKDTGNAVALHAKPVSGGVEFSVCYDGPTIPEEERKQLFVIGATPGTLSSEKTSITAKQQGLFQVRRIADRLGWDANYQIADTRPGDDPALPTLPNILYLTVPSA
jgi:hypothetical protein